MERISTSGFVPPWIRREHQARFEFCARFVAGRRVIDCASGEGLGSRIFLERGARFVIAADNSVTALQHLGNGALVPIAADATVLPIRSGSAEVFIGLETIEHVQSGAAFAIEAARCLREDGVFICSTPNREVTNPTSKFSDRVFNPFHVFEYSREELISDLSAAFGNVEIFGQSPQSRVASAVFNWLGRWISKRFAARVRQATKLGRLIYDKKSRYVVEPMRGDADYEFFVAVCTGTRGARPA